MPYEDVGWWMPSVRDATLAGRVIDLRCRGVFFPGRLVAPTDLSRMALLLVKAIRVNSRKLACQSLDGQWLAMFPPADSNLGGRPETTLQNAVVFRVTTNFGLLPLPQVANRATGPDQLI